MHYSSPFSLNGDMCQSNVLLQQEQQQHKQVSALGAIPIYSSLQKTVVSAAANDDNDIDAATIKLFSSHQARDPTSREA